MESEPCASPFALYPITEPQWGKKAFSKMGRVFYAPTWPLLPQFRWVVLAAAAGDSLRQLVAAQGRGW